jgi:hypothetical protein
MVPLEPRHHASAESVYLEGFDRMAQRSLRQSPTHTRQLHTTLSARYGTADFRDLNKRGNLVLKIVILQPKNPVKSTPENPLRIYFGQQRIKMIFQLYFMVNYGLTYKKLYLSQIEKIMSMAKL